jgi:aldose 1-epimerase
VILREAWGSAGGQPVELFTLSSGSGMTVRIATFGGVVQSISVPDRRGGAVNVALGFAGVQEYVDNVSASGGSAGETRVAYLGAIIGRYANRIARSSFTLDGEVYELGGGAGDAGGGGGDAGDGAGDAGGGGGDAVTLHGGPRGYHTQVWQAAPARVPGGVGVRLSHVDRAGSGGFPGTVMVEVVYAVTRDNALRIEYRARTDAPTVVNLTNHTYFNLAGEGSGDVHDQLLAINAGVVQPVNSTQIPCGFSPVAGTPFDFRAMRPIGHHLGGSGRSAGDEPTLAGGYDQNWVLAGAGYRLAAVAFDPATGIALWTYTDQPGLQLYTANHFAGDLVGTGGRAYPRGGGFALETQHFADTPHHIGDPRWPSVVLRPGQVLRSRTTYKFGLAGAGFAERIRF